MSPATLMSEATTFSFPASDDSPHTRAGPLDPQRGHAGMTEADRRHVARDDTACDLWMVGHEGSTILRCHCDNVSPIGLHLVAPLGYGIAEGQRYELRSRLPGRAALPGFEFERVRWGTVVRTEIIVGSHGDHLGVGVELDVDAHA